MSTQIRSLRVEKIPSVSRAEKQMPVAPADERVIGQGFDLLRSLIADPTLLEQLPDGATIAIIPEDDPEVAQINLEAAGRAAQKGKDTYYHFIGSDGRPIRGTRYRFTIDLRDETWGTAPRPEFDGKTAAAMRDIFRETVARSRQEGSVSFKYQSIVVLNGVRVYVVQEAEVGLYECIAIDRTPF